MIGGIEVVAKCRELILLITFKISLTLTLTLALCETRIEDSNGDCQPQSTEWNLRGLAENSWSVTRFRVE